jgi:hypothetical protein
VEFEGQGRSGSGVLLPPLRRQHPRASVARIAVITAELASLFRLPFLKRDEPESSFGKKNVELGVM